MLPSPSPHEPQRDLIKQLIRSGLDFGSRALGYLFLLNGAAAVALLAKDPCPILPILIFTLGAVLAVSAFGFACAFSFKICSTLLLKGEDLDSKWNWFIYFFAFSPVVLFLLGAFVAAFKLARTTCI
jgi:hypothetical protein